MFGLAGGLTFYSFRAGLQDVQLTVQAIFAPFDVHGTAVVLLDYQRVSCQFLDISIGERIAVAQFSWHISRFDQLAAGGLFFGRGELHLNQLGAQAAANNRTLARFEHGLVHIKLIRIDGALHHRLAQAVAGSDEHHILKARLGVDGEHDPGRAQVRAHHALNTGAQGHVLVGKALVNPVADGTVVVQRGKNFTDFVQDFFNACHVQKSLLLPGKGGVWQIFGGSGRTDGKGRRGVARAQRHKRVTNGLLQVGRKRLLFHHGPNLGADLSQRLHVFGVQRAEQCVNATTQVFKSQEVTESMCCGGKTRGHFDTGWQMRNHLAKAGVFTAN